MYFKRGIGYEIMPDDISATLTAISIIISLLAGAAGAFIYFRVGLENRLTRLEVLLPEDKLGKYETRLGNLEQKMAELGVMSEIIKEVGTENLRNAFRRRPS
jgi:hypothetical protein